MDRHTASAWPFVPANGSVCIVTPVAACTKAAPRSGPSCVDMRCHPGISTGCHRRAAPRMIAWLRKQLGTPRAIERGEGQRLWPQETGWPVRCDAACLPQATPASTCWAAQPPEPLQLQCVQPQVAAGR